MRVDSKLDEWEEVKPAMQNRPALLLGNGASLAVWNKFRYDSLYELASNVNREHHLTKEDRQVFSHLDDTRNFEQVLSALSVGKRINQILDLETWQITERYENIRKCLFSAVGDIHLPYSLLRDETKQSISNELNNYKTIFTTNYDLTTYWSYMDSTKPCKDLFWGGEGEDQLFDPADSMVYEGSSVIYYMHGALHLYKGRGKYTYKHVSKDNDGSLLDLIRRSKEIPLFISEGASRDKKAAILDNTYLAHCYRRFTENKLPLVVFGQSLNEDYDNHIVEGIQKMCGHAGRHAPSNVRKYAVAFSLYPESNSATLKFKARMIATFPDKQLHFFDSRTHPLGNPDLRVS